jgi:hypothetical protein
MVAPDRDQGQIADRISSTLERHSLTVQESFSLHVGQRRGPIPEDA